MHAFGAIVCETVAIDKDFQFVEEIIFNFLGAIEDIDIKVGLKFFASMEVLGQEMEKFHCREA
jgi:hypothetical protein